MNWKLAYQELRYKSKNRVAVCDSALHTQSKHIFFLNTWMLETTAQLQPPLSEVTLEERDRELGFRHARWYYCQVFTVCIMQSLSRVWLIINYNKVGKSCRIWSLCTFVVQHHWSWAIHICSSTSSILSYLISVWMISMDQVPTRSVVHIFHLVHIFLGSVICRFIFDIILILACVLSKYIEDNTIRTLNFFIHCVHNLGSEFVRSRMRTNSQRPSIKQEIYVFPE